MSPQRRSQGLAATPPPTSQRLLRNRWLTARAIKSDLSQSRRRQKKNDSLFEIIVDETFDEDEVKKNIDSDIDSDDAGLNASFIRSHHDIERTIFIHKRNDDERQAKARRKDETQFEKSNTKKQQLEQIFLKLKLAIVWTMKFVVCITRFSQDKSLLK